MFRCQTNTSDWLAAGDLQQSRARSQELFLPRVLVHQADTGLTPVFSVRRRLSSLSVDSLPRLQLKQLIIWEL